MEKEMWEEKRESGKEFWRQVKDKCRGEGRRG